MKDLERYKEERIFNYYQMVFNIFNSQKNEATSRVNVYLLVNAIIIAAFLQVYISNSSPDLVMKLSDTTLNKIIYDISVYYILLEIFIAFIGLLFFMYVYDTIERIVESLITLSSSISFIEKQKEFWYPGKERLEKRQVRWAETQTIKDILFTHATSITTNAKYDYYYLYITVAIGILWSFILCFAFFDFSDKILKPHFGNISYISAVIGLIAAILIFIHFLRSKNRLNNTLENQEDKIRELSYEQIVKAMTQTNLDNLPKKE